MCHNDVCPENVVFRDGIAVALLDFEFAAPGRPVYDVAHLARLCVPIEDEVDQARLGWRPADRPARLRLVAEAYGLERDGRAELLTALNDAIDRLEAAVRRSVDGVTRTPSRCGTGPVAASATTAAAAGGPTTTSSSPPLSSDQHPRRSGRAGAWDRLRIGPGTLSAGAPSGPQDDVVDVVRRRGGPGRAWSLLVDLDVPCR